MGLDVRTAAAFLAALRAAADGGGVTAALASAGMEIPDPARLASLGDECGHVLAGPDLGERVSAALALGYLAGLVAPRRRQRALQDVTAFVMDADLVVRTAQGESILRLPWFEQDMFVGRQLPDVTEIPDPIRGLAVDSYRRALGGERTDYAFTSHGHSFSVDAIPIWGEGPAGRLVLAVATPGRSAGARAAAARRSADRLLAVAQAADQRARESGELGSARAARVETQRAEAARRAAELAAINADRLQECHALASAAPPQLTMRELEVLTLASHGSSYDEIAAQLVIAPATVKTHLAHCYAKLGVPDKAAAVAAVLRLGLID